MCNACILSKIDQLKELMKIQENRALKWLHSIGMAGHMQKKAHIKLFSYNHLHSTSFEFKQYTKPLGEKDEMKHLSFNWL